MVERGEEVPKKKKTTWDSNVITPGTDFMIGLSDFVRYYIRCRISGGGEYWKGLKVIFSDASVPGEGEHKIMAYVRRSRAADGADVNTKHVLHGLDADLIMLGLATHEVNFFILREEVVFGRRSAENLQRVKDSSGYTAKQRELDEQDKQVRRGRKSEEETEVHEYPKDVQSSGNQAPSRAWRSQADRLFPDFDLI